MVLAVWVAAFTRLKGKRDRRFKLIKLGLFGALSYFVGFFHLHIKTFHVMTILSEIVDILTLIQFDIRAFWTVPGFLTLELFTPGHQISTHLDFSHGTIIEFGWVFVKLSELNRIPQIYNPMSQSSRMAKVPPTVTKASCFGPTIQGAENSYLPFQEVII